MTFAALAFSLASVAIGFFLLGRIAGKNAAMYQLEIDVHLRRETLERLARLEGMRLVGHQ